MDKNRKIVLSILILMVLCAVLAVIDISLNMQKAGKEGVPIGVREFGPGVGIVNIYGPISIETSGGGPWGINSGSDAILERLNRLEKDRRIKAIVIRINSPGGTIGATQEIFSKLMKLRNKNIILVASMGELAASGGYYVASACNYIMANHGTLTGSIGVIIMSPDLRGLFNKLGIRMNVIKSGKYKDILAAHRELRDDERALLEDIIDSSYNKFLADVSLGRNLPIDEFKPIADGRLITGASAVEKKLIDEIGTFEDAINKARELAKLSDDSPVYHDIRSPLERFFMSLQSIVGGNRLNINPSANEMMTNFPKVEYRYQP